MEKVTLQSVSFLDLEHQTMEEALASSELEGARSDKSICELIEMSK